MNEDDYISHMRRVLKAQNDLENLGMHWQMIESSAAISCPIETDSILPTLSKTRMRFDKLQNQLIQRMINENLAQLEDELSSKAQSGIDILIRNLFERTADVGFLATDEIIQSFCSEYRDDQKKYEDIITRRLLQYQSKYSVYEDIAITDKDGSIIFQLINKKSQGSKIERHILEKKSTNNYTESFNIHENFSPVRKTLIYSNEITNSKRETIGYLLLQFKFDDEMHRIFTELEDDENQLALIIVDENQRVIATNDETHIPLNAKVFNIPEKKLAPTTFGGREYIAFACQSQGYQGYNGPKWKSQVMVSLLTAFRQHSQTSTQIVDAPIDNTELDLMGEEADAINRDLRRVVWNGRIESFDRSPSGAEGAARLNAVLTQLNRAGKKTRDRVSEAIRDLYRTALIRTQMQADSLSQLATTIIDRNLYERANDCRWWALSPNIINYIDNASQPASSTPNNIDAILDHLNDLYTVYSRIIIFDDNGIIIGSSRKTSDHFPVGTEVPSEWLKSVVNLSDASEYYVSDYLNTDLHELGATYAFMSSISKSENGKRIILGGIAVIFNSKHEFLKMLIDTIGKRDGFAAFVSNDQKVISKSNLEFSDQDILKASQGMAMIEINDAYYACSSFKSKGYREFKNSDGYDNNIKAVVGLRLGRTERRRSDLSEISIPYYKVKDLSQEVNLAIFQVGPSIYAMPTEKVQEAFSKKGLIRTRLPNDNSLGLLEVTSFNPPIVVQVKCARSIFGVTYPARQSDGIVLILREDYSDEKPSIGLMVDDVITVVSVDRSKIQDAPNQSNNTAIKVTGLLDCEIFSNGRNSKIMIQILDFKKASF